LVLLQLYEIEFGLAEDNELRKKILIFIEEGLALVLSI
jgi:hypothetical protein